MDSDSTENVNVEYFAAILGCYPWGDYLSQGREGGT